MCKTEDQERESFLKSIRSALYQGELVPECDEASLSDLAARLRDLGTGGVLLIDEFELAASGANEELALSLARLLPAGCHIETAPCESVRRPDYPNNRAAYAFQSLIPP